METFNEHDIILQAQVYHRYRKNETLIQPETGVLWGDTGVNVGKSAMFNGKAATYLYILFR